jgi:ZIP family zinc transporter
MLVELTAVSEFVTMVVVTTVAGALTGVGALPVFVRTRVSHRVYDAALGLAAGIMVAASVFGLIVPGLEEGPLTAVIGGLAVGGGFLLVANRLIPHIHARFRGLTPEGGADATEESGLQQAILVGSAIVLHNAPEGLAVGVAFAGGLEEVAFLLALVIGLQNIPDGFAFAIPMGNAGLSNLRVLVYTTLSGLVPQVVGSTFGFALVGVATGLFPAAAGFAAGAMMAVVFREMIPSSHGHGHAGAATAAFLAGFVLLLVVDAAFAV